MSDRPIVDVVCGVLIDAEGKFLLSSRPKGKVYEGFWEFPGGKVEEDESPEQALDRELREELGIAVLSKQLVMVKVFDYPHARVRLKFFQCRQWAGELVAREGQDFGFFSLSQLPAPILPATLPILAEVTADEARATCRDLNPQA